MKLSLMNYHELAMNRIKTDQVINNSSKFIKLSLMNLREQAMNWIDPTKLIKKYLMFIKLSSIHKYSWFVMNCFDEPFMNVHECLWTFIQVLHFMNFI